MFSIGGLTGLPLAILPTNFHVHDTYFVVAHFHYVMFGGALFMFIGGLHYWWPKITGRMYNEPLGRLGCLLEFLAFNLTFFPQFILGLHGMPRRSAVYFIPSSSYLHVISTHRRIPADGGVPGDRRPTCCTRCSAARRPRPTPGAARPWNGPAPRRRRTTISRSRPASAGPTTTMAWSGTKRRKVTSEKELVPHEVENVEV